MSSNAINFSEKLALFQEHWAPKIIAQMNDYHFKLVKFKGDFVWHSHPDTDETFIVLSGQLVIDLRDGAVTIGPGELFVVRKGIEHKPRAEQECHLMLVEPAGTVNTGNAGGDLTSPDDVWI